MTRKALIVSLALSALLALPARASDFKASIGFTFADNNVLRDAGETRINSPNAYFGGNPESYFKRLGDSGFGSSRMNLFVYGTAEIINPRFVPEGAVVLMLDPAAGNYRDDGTYLRLNYFLSDERDRAISLTMFPVDSDRMRLGFHYDVTWGGTDMFPKNFRKGLVPGVKLAIDEKDWYAFVGFKTALVRSPTEDLLDNPGGNVNKIVEQTNYAVLGGAGVDIWGGLRFEVNGGYFQKGNNTRANVLGEKIHAGGISAQLSWHRGLPIGRPIDMRLYFEDPIRNDILAVEEYGGGPAFVVALEGNALVQTLEDPDRVHSTTNEWAYSGVLSFEMKIDHFRVFLSGVLRTLEYITYNVPGFVPYQALPESVDTTPEIYGQIAADYFIEPISLTVGLTLGVLKPATFEGVAPVGTYASEELEQGIRKVVVRGAASGDWDILPVGEDEMPVFYSKLSLKWTYGKSFAAIAELTYGRDPNLAQVFRDDRGHAIRSFDDPNILGFGLLARLGF